MQVAVFQAGKRDKRFAGFGGFGYAVDDAGERGFALGLLLGAVKLQLGLVGVGFGFGSGLRGSESYGNFRFGSLKFGFFAQGDADFVVGGLRGGVFGGLFGWFGLGRCGFRVFWLRWRRGGFGWVGLGGGGRVGFGLCGAVAQAFACLGEGLPVAGGAVAGVEQGIAVGVSELAADFLAVLVFLVHVVGDDDDEYGE